MASLSANTVMRHCERGVAPVTCAADSPPRPRSTTPFAAKNYLSTYKKIAAYTRHCKLKWQHDISTEVKSVVQGLLHPKVRLLSWLVLAMSVMSVASIAMQRLPSWLVFDVHDSRAPLIPLCTPSRLRTTSRSRHGFLLR